MSNDPVTPIAASLDNIADAVFHYAAIRPDAPALIEGRETLTYGALARLVAQTTVYLTGLGIKADERVGVALTNSADHVILSLAIMRIGAVLIELPAEVPVEVLAERVTRLDMRAAFVEVSGVRPPAALVELVDFQWRDKITPLSGDVRYGGDSGQLRMIILSSGSTGIPKGLVTTHRQRLRRSLIHQALFGEVWSEAEPGTLLLTSAPNNALFSQFLTNQLVLGGPTVLLPRYAQLIDLVREVATWKDAICPVVPGIARDFISRTDKPGVLFPKLRALFVSGLPLAGHEKLALIQRVTPNLHELYGAGGFGTFSYLAPHEVMLRPDSVGRPVVYPGIDIEIVGPRRQAGATRQQWAAARPRTQCLEQLYNPDDNARGSEQFIDGWYYTGDIVQLDALGFLFLKGRQADAIHTSSRTMYPPEIEEIITLHPTVADAAVVGRPAPGGAGGDELVAFIVGRPGFRHDDIAAHCRQQLPPAQRPAMIYYRDQLPRTGNGKLDRPSLKAAALREAKNEATLMRQQFGFPGGQKR